MTDFGGKLRQARERRGVSLRQIAANTKISVAALEALERNDVSKLPGGIFSRAFVRSYALEVGLNPDDTVREFLQRFDPDSPTPGAAHAPPLARSHAHTPARATAAAPSFLEEESVFESRQRMASVVLKIGVASAVLAGFILYFTLRERPPRAAVHDGAPLPAPAPEPAPTGSAETIRPDVVPATAQQPQPLTLELHPTAACRIVLTVDGARVLSRVMQPGEKETHRINGVAIVEVSDAGAFAFTLDGRPGRPLGQPGEATTARITRETAARYVQ